MKGAAMRKEPHTFPDRNIFYWNLILRRDGMIYVRFPGRGIKQVIPKTFPADENLNKSDFPN